MRYGLIGEKLEHSYSKLIHEKLGHYSYELIPLAPEELEPFIKEGRWQGLNVTIPYKEAVLSFCDRLSERARQIGSVNTLVRGADGSVFGDNTDYEGFLFMARQAGIDFRDQKVLILGSGGTSLTVQAAVRERGGRPVVISRSGSSHYGNLHLHRDAELIVNTTPVGMYPLTEAQPLDLTDFPRCRGVLDVIYNPFYSRLVLQAQALGIPCSGGLTMLVAQAKGAAERFAGSPLPDGLIRGIRDDLMNDLSNLVIIGMPGCGKTTVGKQLAAELGMDFADSDEEVEAAAGMSVPDIFERHGEEAFRKLESEQIQKLGRENRLVIAAGGGVVKDPLNYGRLKQNGVLILLERDPQLLSLKGRPLSKSRKEVMELYRERIGLYEAFADIRIMGNCSIEEVVKNIRERIGK
jgi:shikimate dehydrogenase